MNRDSVLSFTWWAKQIAVGFLSVVFLFFGVGILFSAYQIQNPHEFILVFFGSNLIILISITGVIYAAYRIYSCFKN